MIYFILIILGLGFGSFVNAFVWRWYQLNDKKLSKTEREKLSILKGRSMCPHCRHVLAVTDLIPVFSWLWLRGKCRYCKKHIGWQYPVVELITPILFVVSYVYWPFSDYNFSNYLLLASWLATVVVGVILAVYDFKWMKLPTKIVYFALLPLSIVTAVLRAWYEMNWIVFILAIAGGAIGYGLFYAISAFSHGRLMGDGDVRLMLPLGIIAGGIIQTLATISFASFIALGFAIVISLMGKKLTKNTRIPFGPFLLIGAYIVFLWWPTIQRLLVPDV